MSSLEESTQRERSLEGWAAALFDAIDDAVFVHDEGGKILEANPAACRRLGYSRDEILRALSTPILFVQGTRDSLCPLDLLEKVRAEMKAPNFLHVVEGGDHSLRVPKRQLQASGETQEHVDRGILKAITGFVDRLNLL